MKNLKKCSASFWSWAWFLFLLFPRWRSNPTRRPLARTLPKARSSRAIRDAAPSSRSRCTLRIKGKIPLIRTHLVLLILSMTNYAMWLLIAKPRPFSPNTTRMAGMWRFSWIRRGQTLQRSKWTVLLSEQPPFLQTLLLQPSLLLPLIFPVLSPGRSTSATVPGGIKLSGEPSTNKR